jgi:hypothetical protein
MEGGMGLGLEQRGGDGFIDREGWQTPHNLDKSPAKGEGVLE